MYVKRKGKNNVLFFLGFLLCVLPILLNLVFQSRMENVISSFYLEEDTTQEKLVEDAYLNAELYNQQLFLNQERENYDTVLNFTSTQIMATIQIPVIDVDLAIYHGTSDEVLNRGIGHFEFSSLPVGGKNSHCILTGHRGLPSAKLFTRLDELKKKDQIYIHVCKKTSVYKGYKQDKIEMRGDRAEISDFPLYLNTVAGGLDRRDQTIGGFSFVVKIYAVPVVEIIG